MDPGKAYVDQGRSRPQKVPPYVKRFRNPAIEEKRRGLLPGRRVHPGVAAQIIKRQEIIGAEDRLFSEGSTKEAFTFFSRKTPFIRLTSGVDVKESSEPASEHVLSNGRTYSKDDLTNGYQTGGGHVDIGSGEDFGLRPAAGITGMTLNTHNRYGSLRTATVQFEVHTLEQLDRYEELFMRPGYSALLEWGHSVYLNSKEKDYTVSEIPSLLSDSFLNKSIASSILNDPEKASNENKQTIYQAIADLRERYGFNYDAMYGLIKNFSWSLRPDGGYSCTVDIVSIGTVIESLGIDSGITSVDFRKYSDLEPLDAPEEFTAEGEEEDTPAVVTEEEQAFIDAVHDMVASAMKQNKDEAGLFLTSQTAGTFFSLGKTESAIKPFSKYSDPSPEIAEQLRFTTTDENGKKVWDPGIDEVERASSDYGYYETYVKAPSGLIVRSGPRKKNSDIDLDYKKDPAYSIYNESSIFINFKNPDNTVTEVTYKLKLDEENPPRRLRYTDWSGAAPVEEHIWEFTYRFVLEDEVEQSFTDKEGNLFIPEDIPIINSTFEDFLRDFLPYFTSQIHLILYLIQRQIVLKIGKKLKGPEATKVYKEIPYDITKLDYSPSIDSDYRMTAVRRVLGKDTTNEFYHYIQLGTLLDILNTFIPVSNKEPLFQFHTYKTEPHTYKTLENVHASVQLDKFILPDSYASSKIPRGDILEIFVELDYIRGLLEKNLRTGELKSYDLVTEILENLTTATGKVNEFALQYDEDNFSFHIVDRKLVGDKEQPEHLVLKLIGRDTILRNVTMNSKLSPGISTQIAIAAQSDPSSGGIEGTLFERFNKDLKDRYIVEKKLPRDQERQVAVREDKRKELLSKLATAFNFLRHAYGEAEYVNQQVDLPDVTSQYVVLCSEEKTLEPEERRYGGILPFELTLEIEGISGLQVMDGFRVNQEILPRSYIGDGKFGFLITGLTHKIDKSGWVTEVKSQIYNLPKVSGLAWDGKLRLEALPKDTRKEHPMYDGPSPNANRLRAVLDELGYSERNFVGGQDSRGVTGYKQGELSSGGDITSGLANKSIEVFRKIKERFPKMVIEVTGGKDHYHHSANPNSPHNTGNALDFIVTSGDKKVMGDFIRELDRADGFLGFKNEYEKHVGHTTGNHFHIIYDRSGAS